MNPIHQTNNFTSKQQNVKKIQHKIDMKNKQ